MIVGRLPVEHPERRPLAVSVTIVALLTLAGAIPPSVASASAVGSGTWVTHGPTTPQLVADLAMHPSDPETLYAATSSSTKLSRWGVLKTTDGAQTWLPANQGIIGVGECGCIRNVISLAIDPADPGTVYAGAETGVFKTMDGGTTWTGGGGPRWAYIAIDPSTPGTVYAGSDDFASQTPLDGVFKSTDGGETWTEATSGLDATYGLVSLLVDPFHPGTLFAGTRGKGVFKTTDGGGSWTAANDGLTGLGSSTNLVADPVRPNRIFAGTLGGLFRSTDAGDHWLGLDIGSNGLPAGDYEPLTADPTRPDTIFVGGASLYRTTNGGSTWSALPAGSPNSMQARGDELYIGGYGVYRSTDDGAMWQLAIEGFEIESPVYSLAIDPSDPRRIYAGLDNNSGDGTTIYLSEDRGLTWRSIAGPGLPDGPWVDSIAVPPSRPGTVYLAAHTYSFTDSRQQEKKGVYKTTNYGATWTRVGPPIDVDDDNLFAHGAPAYSLAIDPSSPDTVYAGGRGFVFKTTDGGATWLKLPVGIPELDFVYAVATDPSNPLGVYAGSGTAGLYKSVTGGLGWVPAMAGLTDRVITSLAIDPSDPQKVYAGTCCALSGQVGLYESTNGGLTWALTGLQRHVVSVAVDRSHPQNVYAGTTGEGVWVSEDGGATWADANDGFPATCAVHALAIDPTGARVYAGAEFGQPGCETGGVYVLEKEAA